MYTVFYYFERYWKYDKEAIVCTMVENDLPDVSE